MHTSGKRRNVVRKTLTIFLSCFILLAGCGREEKVEMYQHIDDKEKKTELKEMVEKSKDIDQANVILVGDKLLAAIQVNPWKRYKKQKIESEWQKKLEKKYPNLKVVVSTDFKLYWESTKLLEEADRQKVKDKIDSLKKLAKEET